MIQSAWSSGVPFLLLTAFVFEQRQAFPSLAEVRTGKLSEPDISGATMAMWVCWAVLVVCVGCTAAQSVKESLTGPGGPGRGHIREHSPHGNSPRIDSSSSSTYQASKHLVDRSHQLHVDARLEKDMGFDDEYLGQSPDSFFRDSPTSLEEGEEEEEEEEDFLYLEKGPAQDPFLRDSPAKEQFLYGPNNSRTSRFNFTWPLRDLVAAIDGDITLGALHMVHERSEGMVLSLIHI